jgi:predicted ATPase
MPSALARLTDRELEVLELMAAGLYNETIAARLNVSVKTVETIIRSIFQKLDLEESDGRNRRVVAATLYLEHAPPSPGAHGLPDRLTKFVGRGFEIADLEQQLADRRILTVVGVGGSGKTSLAIEVARRWHEQGRSVVFADLAPARDRLAALSIVWDAAGVVAASERSGLRRLRRVLAEGTSLLVLDNAEQIADDVAALVSDVASDPEVSVLVTSRSPLGQPWEQTWTVPPLEDADADALFLERARAAVDSDDRERLCRAADGLPLAVELLAARCDALGAREVIDRIDDLDTLLSRPGTGRQSSVSRIVDSAHNALSPEGRRLFRSLSVFPGGFSSDHLGVSSEVLHLDALVVLDELLVARLVERTTPDRYRILEPVRNVASNLLDSCGERHDAERVLGKWALAFARAHAWGFTDPNNAAWRAALTLETANTDAAYATALARNDVDLVLDLLGSLAYYWSRHRLVAGRDRAMRALPFLGSERPSRRAAWALVGASLLEDDHERKHLERRRARDWFRATGDERGELVAGFQLAELDGDLTEIDRTIALARRLDARFFEGWLLVRKAARLHLNGAPLDAVLETLDEAECIGRDAENQQLLGGALLARCGLHLSRDQRGDDLVADLQEATAMIEATGDPGLRMHVLCHRVALYLLRNATDKAVDSAYEMTSACVGQLGVESVMEQAHVARVVLLAAAALQRRGHAELASELLADAGDLVFAYAQAVDVGESYPIAPSIVSDLPLSGRPPAAADLAAGLSRCHDSLGSVLRM